MISPSVAAAAPGYDALNKCWLASALLVLRGFAGHLCPAVSSYSWNFVSGHQAQTAPIFRRQFVDEGVDAAVFRPRGSLPPFKGGILDYHLKLLLPRETRGSAFDSDEARWFQGHMERFNLLAAENERFRFGLEAVVDWRFSKDHRAAIARLWSGIESISGSARSRLSRFPPRLYGPCTTRSLKGSRPLSVSRRPMVSVPKLCMENRCRRSA